MNRLKYLFIGTFMLALGVPAMAQDDNSATIEAATKVIKSKPADLEDQLKPIYKKNKKNEEVLVAMGRAFLDIKDTVNALTYAEYAMKANKKYAPAFILLGDIAALNNDGGQAAGYYNQAIYFDPKNPDAYYKYASVYRKISPSEAVGRLEELRAQRPDIAVDAMIGHIYYVSNEFAQAAESYSKADRNALDEHQLTEFAMAYYFSQKYAESLEVAKFGLSKMPRDAAFNRLAFINSTELKDYTNALMYADALFNKSDSAKFSYFDYTYYGNAYNGNKEYDKAIAMYHKALEQEIDNNEKRAGVVKQLSDCYLEKEDYSNAIKYYQDYLKTLGNASANDVAALAQIYIHYADTLKDSTRNEMFKKAEQVYIDMEQKYPDALEYVTFMRARVNSYIDPETKEGLAKPYYEKVVSMIEPRAEKTASDNARLVECYRYLGYYYLLQMEKDPAAKETSTSFWNKILAIDPENEIAKQALTLTKK